MGREGQHDGVAEGLLSSEEGCVSVRRSAESDKLTALEGFTMA